MQDIEQRLQYKFKNKNLLKQALTHSSVTGDIRQNYERLEFLGDRILGLTIAELLYQTFPNEPEGALAQRFVGLVCKETVAAIVLKLGLEKDIIASDSEIILKTNVLCDIGEAVIAAVYLDSNDIKTARNFIKLNWESLIDSTSLPHKDFKTALQEKAAALKLKQPQYKVLKKSGPEHEPIFLIEVAIGNLTAQGSGSNKKLAEQEAARSLLEKLEQKNG